MEWQLVNLTKVDYAIITMQEPDVNDHTSSPVVFKNNPNRIASDRRDKDLLVHYSLDASYKKKCVADKYEIKTSGCYLGAQLSKVWWHDEHGAYRSDKVALHHYAAGSSFDVNTVTYRTGPEITGIASGTTTYLTSSYGSVTSGLFSKYANNEQRAEILRKILDYGMVYSSPYADEDGNRDETLGICSTSYGLINISVYLSTTDNGYDITGCAPSSGFVPKYAANTFTWGTVIRGASVDPVTISDFKFRWRYTGASEYNEVDCGTNNYCTIPANTFAQNSVDWCVVLTDSWGATSSSLWMTLSTQEVTSTCECVSPKNTTVETGNPLTFKWNHIISTGTLPTQTDLQYSSDGISWSTLATVSGSATQTDIPANTFVSGQYYWRARTYNTDNTAGSWSDSVSFICVGNPTISGLRATTTPQTTVSWQSTDQLGYQVMIDGFDSGVIYGTDYRYQYTGYLADGEHTIKARVINQYGLWSNWSTINVTVSHTEGAVITLSASHRDAHCSLSWNTSGSYTEYIVYRDGVEIGRTAGFTYSDDMGIGSVEYRVRGIFSANQNYSLSNVLPINLVCEVTKISRLGTNQWLDIPNSDTQTRDIVISMSSETTAKHYLNSVYPIAELSKQRNRYMNIRVAFTSMYEANAFASLLNSVVVCKTNKQTMITGLITSISMTENEFFYGFNCRIQQTGEV